MIASQKETLRITSTIVLFITTLFHVKYYSTRHFFRFNRTLYSGICFEIDRKKNEYELQ